MIRFGRKLMGRWHWFKRSWWDWPGTVLTFAVLGFALGCGRQPAGPTHDWVIDQASLDTATDQLSALIEKEIASVGGNYDQDSFSQVFAFCNSAKRRTSTRDYLDD